MAETQQHQEKRTDAITLGIEKGAGWIATHWQQVGLALAAVLAAGALGGVVFYNLRKLRALAWEQLSTAQGLASRGQRDQALQTVDQLLNSTRSGPIVSQAYLFKGDVLLLENKGDEAIQAYHDASAQATSPELKALAEVGVGTALEQFTKWPESETAYKDFIKTHPEHFLTGRVYLSLGRVQMIQQKWPDAQATLERLVTLYPTTAWAKDAQDYLQVVKAHLPQAPPAGK